MLLRENSILALNAYMREERSEISSKFPLQESRKRRANRTQSQQKKRKNKV